MFIPLPILLVLEPNLVQNSPFSLLICAKFKGNLITILHFMAEMCKKKKISDSLKTHISGMACAIFFKSGM